MQQFLAYKGAAAAKLSIFFIYAYSPCYNMGYNALTNISCRAVPVRAMSKRHHHIPVLRPKRGVLHHLRKPDWTRGYHVAVADNLLLLARFRDHFHLVPFP
jgi:hypothetical protein